MAKTPTYQMKGRMMVVLAGMIILGFGIVLHQLFSIQILQGEEYQQIALDQQMRSTRIGAKRGTIYDTNGKALATSADVSSVCVAPGMIDDDEERKNVTAMLVKMLGVDEALVAKKLDKKNSLYEVVKTKVEKPVTDELMQQVLENGLQGRIFLEGDTRRYYPYGNLAATVLGFTNADNDGAYGLESYYNKTLAGTPGRTLAIRDSKGQPMSLQYEETQPAQDGNSLVLTIDETIQHYLEKNLETAVDEHKVGDRTVGIVMDVETGAILAMSTKPDFDPNNPTEIIDKNLLQALEEAKPVITAIAAGQLWYDYNAATDRKFLSGPAYDTLIKNAKYLNKVMGLNTIYALIDQKNEEGGLTQEAQEAAYRKALQNAQYAQWRNKAVSDPYEPGSVFKIITAAGALESHAVTENSTFNCIGYIEVADKTQHCHIWSSQHQGHGVQTLEDAVRNSCNPAFIQIGQLMGSRLFSEYFSNFGLTELTGIDMPGEASGLYHKVENMGIAELSSSSFGQTFTITPLQMITAANAAVNGGKLMQPYIVKQVVDKDGNVVSATQPVVKRQVISKDISDKMQLMLEQVVANGSGRQAQIPGYRVGGKTGTSEKIGTRNLDGSENTKNILSFYGFAPIDNPKVACLVVLDEPDLINAYGSTVAAPVVGSILADVLPYMGIEPQYTQEQLEETTTSTPNVTDKDIHDAQSILRIAGLKYRQVGSGTTVLRQVPGYQEPIPKDATVVLYTEENVVDGKVLVPNVVGMTAGQANKEITNAGLNYAMMGSGIEGTSSPVIAQNPLAGIEVEKGTIVTVEFAESAPAE